jgi:hypothetical protein
MKRLPPIFPILLLMAGLATLGGPYPAHAADQILHLPEVIVTDKMPPPRIEGWRYTETAGYAILSQTDDPRTQELARHLAVISWVVKTIWPAPRAMVQKPTTLIFCRDEKTFAGFIPSFVREAVNPTLIDRLFLHDAAQEIIVLESYPAGDEGRFKEVLRDNARRSLLSLQQAPPDWFVTGMTEIIADADCRVSASKLTIRYAALREVTPGADQPPPSLYETERPSPAVREVIRNAFDNRSRFDLMAEDAERAEYRVSHNRFNDYFALHHYHPSLLDVLENKPSLEPDDYRMTCWAFVHLCAFAQKRGYTAPLGKLLHLEAKNPTGDKAAMFREAFHLSTGEMDVVLRDYSEQASSAGAGKEIALGEVAPLVIRNAEAAEIGRIKADAYRLGGHPDEAEAELKKLRHSGR